MQTLKMIKNFFAVCVIALATITAPTVQAFEAEEKPSAAAMAIDGIVVRPISAVATVLGAAVWTVTLPFSLLGGNALEAGEVLVGEPFKATFIRCLGCKITGKKLEFERKEEEVEEEAYEEESYAEETDESYYEEETESYAAETESYEEETETYTEEEETEEEETLETASSETETIDEEEYGIE